MDSPALRAPPPLIGALDFISETAMTHLELVEALESYSAELQAILGRFKKATQGIWIDQGDHGRFKQISLELIDLLRDEIQDGNMHAVMIAERLNESVNNYSGSPSYRGVENVMGIVNSLVTRVSRSPGCVRAAEPNLPKAETSRKIEAVYHIGERFRLVARQLRRRHDDRPT